MHKIFIYLHIIHLLKSSTCFDHYPAHLQEVYVVIVYIQPVVSSLFSGFIIPDGCIVFIQFYFDLFVLVYLSCLFSIAYLDDWLTVHRSITLLDFQLDAQNSYLFTYNTCIKILYMFRPLPCSSSGSLRLNCIYAVTIPEAAYIQLRRRPPEDEQSNARNM
jgi:hypothetical protein